SLKYLSGLWLIQNGQPEEGLKCLHYALKHTSKEEIKILSSQSISQHALLVNDIAEEVRFLEKAVSPGRFDRRLYLALDEALHKKQDPGARNRLAESVPEAISHRGDIAFRRARLLFDNGQPEKTLSVLVSHKFSQHEGQAYVRRLYVDCLLVNGFSLLAAGNFQEAARNFAKIMEFPENLGSTSHYLGEHSRLARFMLAMIDDALGERKKAESRRQDILSKKETGAYNGAEFSERRKLSFDEFAAIELSAKELACSDFERPEMPVGKDDLAKQENRISKAILDKLLNNEFAKAVGIAEKAVNDYPCSALLRKMSGLAAAMRKIKSVPEALALIADM
ncbi:MAG: hypothetical protein PHV82_01870, partial [Victivallaceae bacterium]|nr:hypothetical protein [Victivallaceae bacterium]